MHHGTMRLLYRKTVALLALGAALVVAGTSSRVDLYEYWREALWIGLFTATLGRAIATKRPEHSIARLFAAVGLCAAVQLVAGAYAALALEGSTALPLGVPAAWLASLVRQPSFFSLILLFHLFPTGAVLRPGWSRVLLLGAAGIALHALDLALSAGGLEDFPAVSNPLGVVPRDVLDRLAAVPLVVFLMGGGLLSLTLRFRASRGVERQQLKWFFYAVLLSVGGLTLLNVLLPRQMEGELGFYAWLFLPLAVLAAVALAILRYRLYEIDVIINRTLVYAALTTVLALVYVAGVVGMGGLVRRITGQANTDLAVAASTLAVAGLFRPARARIQAFIDRRFFRRRYDAELTSEAFSARLRDELDLDALTHELVRVVRHTVEPTHVSVWLRN
jgi:hypothetical protein